MYRRSPSNDMCCSRNKIVPKGAAQIASLFPTCGTLLYDGLPYFWVNDALYSSKVPELLAQPQGNPPPTRRGEVTAVAGITFVLKFLRQKNHVSCKKSKHLQKWDGQPEQQRQLFQKLSSQFLRLRTIRIHPDRAVGTSCRLQASQEK